MPTRTDVIDLGKINRLCTGGDEATILQTVGCEVIDRNSDCRTAALQLILLKKKRSMFLWGCTLETVSEMLCRKRWPVSQVPVFCHALIQTQEMLFVCLIYLQSEAAFIYCGLLWN